MSSEEGKGTQFWLEIPLKFDDEDEIPEPVSLEGKSILLIGHSYFCTNYSQTLSQWGADTVLEKTLNNTILKNTGYDLVITNDEDAAKKLEVASFKVIQIHRGLIEKSPATNIVHMHEPVRPSVLKETILTLLG